MINSYSILLCTFNGSTFIKPQLESILNQTISPQKIVIADDGSTDNTLEIAQEIFEKWQYTDYEIVHNQYHSASANFLYSLKYLNADYIFLADQDDIWEKDKAFQFLAKAKSVDNTIPTLIFSDASLIDEKNNIITESFFIYQNLTPKIFEDDSILYKNCVQGASCAINRTLQQLVLHSLNFVKPQEIYMHDWWIALIAKYYGQITFITLPLLQYRQHHSNQIGAINYKRRLYYYFRYFSLYIKNFRKAIIQAKTFSFFVSNSDRMTQIPYPESKNRCYTHVPILKRIILKLFSL